MTLDVRLKYQITRLGDLHWMANEMPVLRAARDIEQDFDIYSVS